MYREHISEEIALEEKSKWKKETMKNLDKEFSKQDDSQGNGPEMGTSLPCSESRKVSLLGV